MELTFDCLFVFLQIHFGVESNKRCTAQSRVVSIWVASIRGVVTGYY